MVSKEFSLALMVSNGKKSAKWYEDVLGFETYVKGHWVLVWPKGSTAKIHLCEGKPEPGNSGIAFWTKDIKRKAAKMKADGAKFTQNVTKTDWSTMATVADPDGNEIFLFEGDGPLG